MKYIVGLDQNGNFFLSRLNDVVEVFQILNSNYEDSMTSVAQDFDVEFTIEWATTTSQENWEEVIEQGQERGIYQVIEKDESWGE